MEDEFDKPYTFSDDGRKDDDFDDDFGDCDVLRQQGITI